MKKAPMNSLVLMLLMFSLQAEQIKLEMSTPHPVIKANRKNTVFVKVALTGFEMKNSKRPPVNVAIVLDKSGSMAGDKMRKAKMAAINAVNRLQANDIISIIAYDNGVQVLVPATKVSDKEAIIKQIQSLDAQGGTALFSGVSKGAAEVRKFIKKESVNRVILLSDGQANQGPSSPAELGELGVSLIKENISVSTIGLGNGYNDDLMIRLASKSDGNHIFAETPQQLIAAFNRELGDVLSVVAQEIVININCAPGVRPVRVLGREAEIQEQKVLVHMNQINSKQEKFIILEVEIPSADSGSTQKIASTSVSYSNMQTKVSHSLSSQLAVRFSKDQKLIDKSLDQNTMIACISLQATLRNGQAMKLRDQGKVQEAQQILLMNCNILHSTMTLFPSSSKLNNAWNFNKNDFDNIIDTSTYQTQRKRMNELNRAVINQQVKTFGYTNLDNVKPRRINEDELHKNKK